MLAVLDLQPVRRPARLIGPVAPLDTKPSRPILHAAREQIRPDLAMLERRNEDVGRRANRRPRLVLRIDNGRPRKSSPSSARMSKA
jgi:hypothetical protein